MKKPNNILFLLIGGVLIFLATSCESVLFIELEESDKLIVLNGVLGSDSIAVVQVSRTRHILDNAELMPLENASVSLYMEGNLVEQLGYVGNGHFRSGSFIPPVGVELTVEVEQQGYSSVSARCEIPEAVGIVSVDTSTVIREFGDYSWSYAEEIFQMDVTIKDPPGVENFYLLNLQVDRSFTEWRDTTYQYVDSLHHNDEWHYFVADSTYTIGEIFRFIDHPRAVSPDLVVEAITDQGILFSDQLIDGKDYSVRAEITTGSLRSADSAIVDIRLHSISESYYRYLKSRQKHYESTDDPFAVPVIVYTNVEGGVGFLGGYSSDLHRITTFVSEYGDDYYYHEYY
jgi:hypothetical protein